MHSDDGRGGVSRKIDDPKERRIHEVFSEALKEAKPSIRAKMWAYRGVSVKLNVFDFRVSRHRDGPLDFFENYTGTLVGDCYSGFESIVVDSNGAMVRAACNAHYPEFGFIWRDSAKQRAA